MRIRRDQLVSAYAQGADDDGRQPDGASGAGSGAFPGGGIGAENNTSRAVAASGGGGRKRTGAREDAEDGEVRCCCSQSAGWSVP